MLRSSTIVAEPLVLVTGADGFVGGWLIPVLLGRGWSVVGTRLPGGPPGVARSGVEWVELDLCEPGALDALMKRARPRFVIHLAAIAQPREAAADPFLALRTNYIGVDILLRAVHRHVPEARVLSVGTGEAYGLRPADTTPLREDEPLRPPSIYSATKAAAEALSLLAVERDGLDVICARPLNHSGRGRPPVYVESAFARQIARIERGDQPPVMRVGNLEGIRDFSDVRDVVEAYATLLEHGERGLVYNICSGRGRRIQELLDHLLARSEATPRIETDPTLYQPTAPDRCAIVGDPSRMRGLGWRPRFPFEQTLDDLLDQWRTEPA